MFINRVCFALIVVLLVLVFGFIIATKAEGAQEVLVCHKPGTPAEHWLRVDKHALPAHLAHGDWLYPEGGDVCGGESVLPPEPIATEEPSPIVTPEPPQEPPETAESNSVFLPFLSQGCTSWPWCVVPHSQ